MIKLDNPASAIAAIPALLSYTPAESLVLVYLRAGIVYVTANFEYRDDTENIVVEHAIRTATTNRVDGVLIIAVAARHAAEVIGHADRVRDALTDSGIRVVGSYHTYSVEAGVIWTDLINPQHTGTVGDPLSSAAAASRVFAGSPIARTRAELEARFEVTDPATAPDAEALAAVSVEQYTIDVLTELSAVVAADGPVPPELAGRMGALTTLTATRESRDALLGIARIDYARAGRVLVEGANQNRGLQRCNLLTIAAVCWIGAGEGIIAAIALDQATRAARAAGEPLPALLRLIRTACDETLPPSQHRAVIHEVADELTAKLGIVWPTITT